jgi:NAD(P)-dependent dehydrogenase (short-subunit alcohol dehydrogenase family)
MSVRTAARTALITGGSRGIGLAVARELLDRGMSVCITGRKQPGLDAAINELAEGDRVLAVAGSTADPEHRARTVALAVERFGSLDILVNNAGINPTIGPLMATPLETVAKALQTNVLAPLGWIQVAVNAWMGEHGGSVVNVGSIAGLRTQQGLGAYTTSKAALLHMTRQLALELAPQIRVNAVVPALVKTRFASALWEDNEASLLDHYPLGRLGTPQDVAKAIVFLVGDDASWITGEQVVVDGGLLVNDAVSEPG